jgi:LysW-gamma-L-lysine carboxypeptidase
VEDLALLEGLLSHYSPTGSEGAAVTFLVEWMREHGFDAFVDGAGNAVGSLGNGANEIMLLGHIDTVPGEIAVRREGDILWGRGSVDAKGPLACFTIAASRLQLNDTWKVTVIGAVAEEGDSDGCRYLLERFSPNFVVIGEPSGCDQITLGYKGIAWLRYQLRKPMTHTASRHSSACETAVEFWNRLLNMTREYNNNFNRRFDQITPSLRHMDSSAGEFEENARLDIGLRLPPDLSVEQAFDLCAELAEEGELQLVGGMPAYRSDKNSPLVRALLAAIRKSGSQPSFVLKTGTSDMNLAGPAWNCPIVAYGPGDSDLDHTPDEHIHISEYLTSIQVLTDALQNVVQTVNIEKASAGTK